MDTPFGVAHGKGAGDPRPEKGEVIMAVTSLHRFQTLPGKGADEQFQNFWMEVSANPSADLIRSGIYMNLA